MGFREEFWSIKLFNKSVPFSSSEFLIKYNAFLKIIRSFVFFAALDFSTISKYSIILFLSETKSFSMIAFNAKIE